MQPQIENEDTTWRPWCNLPATRTNKCRASSLQEVELDGWFLILHIVLKHVPYNSCTSLIWVLYFISIFLDWRLGFTRPFNWIAKIWEPFKMKLIWGLQSWTLISWVGLHFMFAFQCEDGRWRQKPSFKWQVEKIFIFQTQFNITMLRDTFGPNVGNIWEYYVEYCQSHITSVCIWIMLWRSNLVSFFAKNECKGV